jgi:hypothetical protein
VCGAPSSARWTRTTRLEEQPVRDLSRFITELADSESALKHMSLHKCHRPDSQCHRHDHGKHAADEEVRQYGQRRFTGKNGESFRFGPRLNQ